MIKPEALGVLEGFAHTYNIEYPTVIALYTVIGNLETMRVLFNGVDTDLNCMCEMMISAHYLRKAQKRI